MLRSADPETSRRHPCGWGWGVSHPTAYPLAWPHGWPRTDAYRRERWPSAGVTLDGSLKECQAELRRLGATNIVLSSDCTLGMTTPNDPGVVAYCLYDGMQAAIPCDRWNTVAGNLRAIAKTIEAMRGMERWGAKHMIKAMFQGFTALPEATAGQRPWYVVLGLNQNASLAMAEETYRTMAKKAHPDAPGGSHEKMAALNAAIAEARKVRAP